MSAFEVQSNPRVPAARAGPLAPRLVPDPDDIRAARRLHVLARAERDQGRLDRAESLAIRALGLLEQVASTSHPEVSAVLGTLIGIRERRQAEQRV